MIKVIYLIQFIDYILIRVESFIINLLTINNILF